MAFKLTKTERNARDDIIATLEIEGADVTAAIIKANEVIQAALTEANDVIAKYNGTLEEARNLREDITTRLQDEYDNKSDKWQEGNKASAVTDLINAWADLDLEAIDELQVGDFDTLEENGLEHRNDLEEVSTEIEQ